MVSRVVVWWLVAVGLNDIAFIHLIMNVLEKSAESVVWWLTKI